MLQRIERAITAAREGRVTGRGCDKYVRVFLALTTAVLAVVESRDGIFDPSTTGMMAEIARFVTPAATAVNAPTITPSLREAVGTAMAAIHIAQRPWQRDAAQRVAQGARAALRTRGSLLALPP
jgi:hypothetical protein